MTDKEFYFIYMDVMLEKHAVEMGMDSEIMDDLYVGMVGFAPGTHPLAEFTNDHGIKHNPGKVEGILQELIFFTMQKYTFDSFIENMPDKNEVIKVFHDKSSMSYIDRFFGLRELLFNEQMRKFKLSNI